MGIIALIVFIATVVIGYGISWAIIVGAIWGIAWCFSIPFSLKIATGIWLVLCVAKAIFTNTSSKK